MKLYDHIIENLSGRIRETAAERRPYRKECAWNETEEFEMLMQKDMAYELGGGGKPAVSFTCITNDPNAVTEDEILIFGPDLPALHGNCSYARIAVLFTEELAGENDAEGLCRAIRELDYVKYHVFPKGYMMRVSGQTNREQVRIAKTSLAAGMNFERIGDSFICRYKQDPRVRHVRMIFVTAEDADYEGMRADAKSVSDITASLSKIMKGLPTECGDCGLREVCDEVEDLRKLHFGQKTGQ